MTDRVKGFTVTLEHDIRVDDIEILLNAVRQLRGVAGVDPVITTSEDHFARARLKVELRGKMYKFIDDNL